MICIRHVCPQTYEVHEDCIGLYSTNKTNADQLTCLIKDALIRSNLPCVITVVASVMMVLPSCQGGIPVWQHRFNR